MSSDQFSKCSDRYKFQYRQRRPINEEVPNVKHNEVAKTPFENGKDLFLSISWKFKDVDIQDKNKWIFSSKSEAGVKLDTILLECQINRQQIEKTQICSFKNFLGVCEFFQRERCACSRSKIQTTPLSGICKRRFSKI